jgi:RNA polymerase sigma factor (sigma-70 family)
MTPSSSRCGVVEAFDRTSAPVFSSTAARSVNVPPMSIATRCETTPLDSVTPAGTARAYRAQNRPIVRRVRDRLGDSVNGSASSGLCSRVEVYRHRTDGEVRAIEGEGVVALPRHDIEAVYRASAPQLARAVYAYVGGRRHLAEDAVAEAFARALEHVEEIRTPLPWIYATAFRLAGRELKRERRPAPEMPDPVPGVDPIEVREVLEALARLPLNQRAAVVLHDQEGMTAPEVARLLGMSPATVRVHLFRARKRLRAVLAAEEEADA